ncbi:uncharacterized protein METZ01_LOCUS280256, partial [marine metagenome]
MYQSLNFFRYNFVVIGDDLSTELLGFFNNFNDVIVDNTNLGGAA